MVKILIKNKKAFFNYQIIDTEISGIILVGSEVKSVKNFNVDFTDTYCIFIKNEIWVKNLNISDYVDSMIKHDPKRDKKLLLTKRQIKKFKRRVEEDGLTIIPLNIFVNDKGLIKMEIALAKGKREYDKKNSIRDLDLDRDMKRQIDNR